MSGPVTSADADMVAARTPGREGDLDILKSRVRNHGRAPELCLLTDSKESGAEYRIGLRYLSDGSRQLYQRHHRNSDH